LNYSIFIYFIYSELACSGDERVGSRAFTRIGRDAGPTTRTDPENNKLLDRLAVTASLDFLTRMEGTDGKAMSDLYTRMVGAQQ
jgi:hypothetical protein